MSAPHLSFYSLPLAAVSPEAGPALTLTLAVPPALRSRFVFAPGQFLTVRAQVQGRELRRSYSICSARSRYEREGVLELGVRVVDGGAFSNWALATLKAGDSLEVMPPDGRFIVRRPRALHRVGFAAGSGITPILSIMASTLEEQPSSKFTLVYGNRRFSSVMFNEALQDLKDRYPDRLTLIHILSRQAQEVDLLQGRVDAAKVQALLGSLLPAASMDEVFTCGPASMIDEVERALLSAGVPAERLRSERFASPDTSGAAPSPSTTAGAAPSPANSTNAPTKRADCALTVIVDGKPHELPLGAHERVLDVALHAGLDLPYSCKAGVCCTCRARVLEGEVVMDKNFTLEPGEIEQGFVLTCQARAVGTRLVVSYDER